MSDSKKDAKGGHRKPSEHEGRRGYRLRPYGEAFPGFIQECRRDGMHSRQMRKRARQEQIREAAERAH